MSDKNLLRHKLERAVQHWHQFKRINSRLRALPANLRDDTTLKLNEQLIAISEAEIQKLRAELGMSPLHSREINATLAPF